MEQVDGIEFRDSKNNYVFLQDPISDAGKIEKTLAPRDSQYRGGLIHEDNNYVYLLKSKIIEFRIHWFKYIYYYGLGIISWYPCNYILNHKTIK